MATDTNASQNKIDPNSKSLYVTVRTPDKVLFEGEATAVTSDNEKGVFDVLGQHGNFISVIQKTIVVHLPDKTTKEFPVEKGVLRVIANYVTVLLGIEAVTKGAK